MAGPYRGYTLGMDASLGWSSLSRHEFALV